MMPQAFFFLKIVVAILSLCDSIQILGLFHFCEKSYRNFDRDCIESIDFFWQYGHFTNINSPKTQVQNIFPFICIFFSLFHQCLTVSVYKSFLVKFIPEYLFFLVLYPVIFPTQILLYIYIVFFLMSYNLKALCVKKKLWNKLSLQLVLIEI